MALLRELSLLSAHRPQTAAAVTSIKAADFPVKEQDLRWEKWKKASEG